MSQYKAVIFDFFGTLTEGRCAPEDKIVARWKLDQRERYNYNFVEDVVCGTACEIPFTEVERSRYFKTLINKLQLPQDSERVLRQIFDDDIVSEKLIGGAIDMLEYCKSKNYKMGMISDIPNPDYDIAKKLGFDHLFDFRHLSYNAEWVKNGKYLRVLKPDPAIFRRVLQKLRTEVNETLMIGNSLKSDITPARKIGMRAILVDYHNRFPDDEDRISSL